jgi:hypothetical protein
LKRPPTTAAQAALAYHEAGWHPIELPAGAKGPPPEGRTGYGGNDMTTAEVEAAAWVGNVGLRMPPDVIGLDVDVYRGGDRTMRELFARCGELPATWISHSGRNDGSGIRYYRVPVGLAWVAGLAGIDIIRQNHRYAAAAPSVHPDGRPYGWVDQNELAFTQEIPRVEDLPELPWPWIRELSRARQGDTEGPVQAAEPDEVEAFLTGHNRADQPGYVGVILAHFDERWRAGHSRHDSMTHALLWAMETVRAGIASGRPTVDLLAAAWIEAVSPDARRAQIASPARTTEFAAMLRHAVGKVAGKPEAEMRKFHDDIAGVPMNVPSPNGLGEVTAVDRLASRTRPNILTADCLDVRPAPQLIRGWFPRAEVCIVAGKPNAGKGVVLADIIARGTRGDDMPNGDRLLGAFTSAVVCLPGEDSANEWARRLTVAQALLDRVMLVETTVDDAGGEHPVNMATAALVVEDLARGGAELIALDSLTGLTNTQGFDTNKGEVRAVLDALSTLARAWNVTIVLIHHTRKAGGDPLDVLQGNTQIGAASRSVLVAVEERGDDGAEPDVRLFGVAKLNGSKRSAPVGYRTVGAWLSHPDGAPMRDDRGDIAYIPRVEWVKDRTFTQGELIAASNGSVIRSGGRDKDAADILALGPMRSTDYLAAMAEAGYSTEQARRARERVGHTIQHDSHWWTYPASMSAAEAKQAIVCSEIPDDTPT